MAAALMEAEAKEGAKVEVVEGAGEARQVEAKGVVAMVTVGWQVVAMAVAEKGGAAKAAAGKGVVVKGPVRWRWWCRRAVVVTAVVERAGERMVMRASGWSSGGRDTLHLWAESVASRGGGWAGRTFCA